MEVEDERVRERREWRAERVRFDFSHTLSISRGSPGGGG